MWPIIGTEALASGALTRGQLRWNYTAIHPNVYLANGHLRTIETNAHAAWLWTRRTGIIAGRAAAALNGVDVIDDWVPIDVVANHGKRRPDIVVHEERIEDDEVRNWGELRVTTPARTALDLARWLPRNAAVDLLDRLAAATGIDRADVEELAARYRGAHGIPRACSAIPLMDGGTRSTEETRLRLTLLDGGLPKPRTSILLQVGLDSAVIGMGWDGPKVGVSIWHGNGSDGRNAVQDVRHQEVVQRLGWIELRVTPDQPGSVVHRVRRALRLRGG